MRVQLTTSEGCWIAVTTAGHMKKECGHVAGPWVCVIEGPHPPGRHYYQRRAATTSHGSTTTVHTDAKRPAPVGAGTGLQKTS